MCTCIVHHAAGRGADVAGAVVEHAALGHEAGQAARAGRRGEVAHGADAGRRGSPGGRGAAQARVCITKAIC